MKTACAHCPFLRSPEIGLRKARKHEIATALRQGGEFSCHKTVDYSHEDEEGDTVPRVTGKSEFCAGAILTMLNEKTAHLNQMVRIHERFGSLNLDEMTGHERVFGSLSEWVRADADQEPKTTKRKGKK